MEFYYTDESFNWKKSKLIEVLCKIAVGILCGICIFLLYGFIAETKQLAKNLKYGGKNSYEGYYCFQPNQKFWLDSERYSTGHLYDPKDEKLYTVLVSAWQEKGLEIMRYDPYLYAIGEQYAVFTYEVPKAYTINWEGAVLEMEKGEWFRENEKSLVVLKGKNYKVGDMVEIIDKNGKTHKLSVCGIAKEQFLITTMSPSGKIMWNDRFEGQDSKENIFLLNPLCELNPPKDVLSTHDYGCIKTNNYLLQSEIKEYGRLQPIKIVDSSWQEINRSELVKNYETNLPKWTEVPDYFLTYHLWYIVVFPIIFAGIFILIYNMNQWNYAKRLWIYILVGSLVARMISVARFPELFFKMRWIAIVFLLIVLIYDFIIKKNTVHGRTYIVDGWDETDIEI